MTTTLDGVNFFDRHMRDGNVVTITHMDGREILDRCDDKILARFIAGANAPVCVQIYGPPKPTIAGTVWGPRLLTEIYRGPNE